jgi:ribonuclease VapC
VVLDTSAILAIYFGEPDGAWCVQTLDASPDGLSMSTVNLTECLILAEDRIGLRAVGAFRADLEARHILFVAPDEDMAVLAAQARHRFPLNLGDCFAYALAKAAGQSLVTLNRDFKRTDIAVLLPPKR